MVVTRRMREDKLRWLFSVYWKVSYLYFFRLTREDKLHYVVWVKLKLYIYRKIETGDTFNASWFQIKFLLSKWLRLITATIRFALHCFFFHHHFEIVYTWYFSMTEYKL